MTRLRVLLSLFTSSLLLLPILFVPLSCVIVACATVLLDCRRVCGAVITCYVVLDADVMDLQDSAYHTHARRCSSCLCPAAVALVAGATV